MLTFLGLGPSSWPGDSSYTDYGAFSPLYLSIWILYMCPISDDLLPSDEVFLGSLIQSDLLLDVGSVVTKSNPDFPSKHDLSSYVGLVEFFDSSFEQKVSDLDDFDFSYEVFNFSWY